MFVLGLFLLTGLEKTRAAAFLRLAALALPQQPLLAVVGGRAAPYQPPLTVVGERAAPYQPAQQQQQQQQQQQ